MRRSTQCSKDSIPFQHVVVVILVSTAGLVTTNTAMAAIITIDSADDTGTLNGALFEVLDVKAAGTGHVDSFLRIQHQGNNTTESGYNTGDPRNNFPAGFPDFDQKTGNFTYNIKVGDVGTHIVDDINYGWFLLDLGEPGNDGSAINLVELKILVSPDANVFLDGDESKLVTNPVGGPTWDLVFDLDGNEDNTAILTDLFSGNGTTDISISIPVANFAGQGPGEFLYLWAKFTDAGGSFEEFIARTPGIADEPPIPGPGIPEPATFGMAILGALGLFALKRRNRHRDS